MWEFQNPVCLSIYPYPEKRNHHSFVNISPTLVIDTSMERSSRVLHHWNIKIWLKKTKLNFDLFFFFSKFEIEFWLFFLSSKLNFDLCWRAEIIQVGLNKHLYDDIGDASSSLRGSTSSLMNLFSPICWWCFFVVQVKLFHDWVGSWSEEEKTKLVGLFRAADASFGESLDKTLADLDDVPRQQQDQVGSCSLDFTCNIYIYNIKLDFVACFVDCLRLN